MCRCTTGIQAIGLMCSSKKSRFSANQFLPNALGVDHFKTGCVRSVIASVRQWRSTPTCSGQLSGEGKTIEIDETFIGKKAKIEPWQFSNERGWHRHCRPRLAAQFPS